MPAAEVFRAIKPAADLVFKKAPADITNKVVSFMSTSMVDRLGEIRQPDGKVATEAQSLWERLQNVINNQQGGLATVATINGQRRNLVDDARNAVEKLQILQRSKPHVKAMFELQKAVENPANPLVSDSRLHLAIENKDFYKTLNPVEKEVVDLIESTRHMTGLIFENSGITDEIIKDAKGNVVSQRKVGGMILDTDGDFVPFKAGAPVSDSSNGVFLRMGSNAFYAMLSRGMGDPMLQKYIAATIDGNLSKGTQIRGEKFDKKVQELVNGGMAQPDAIKQATAEHITGVFRDMVDSFNLDLSTDGGGTKHIAQEFARRIPYMPSMIKNSLGQWDTVFESHPVRYAERMFRGTMNRTSYTMEFGQGVDQKRDFVDENGNPMTVEYSSPDTWLPTRNAIKDNYGAEGAVKVDELQRVTNGMPLDRYRIAYDSPAWHLLQGYDIFTGMYKSLLLSASSFANLAESTTGNTPALLGYGNYFKTVSKLISDPAYREYTKIYLDQIGAISRSFIDLSANPNHPIMSGTRAFQQLSGRAFGHHYINEMQEFLAAATAREMVNGVISGQVGGATLKAAIRQMDALTPKEVDLLFDPTVPTPQRQALGERVTRAAAQYLSASPMSAARQSRAAHTRAFNILFPFNSYGMKKLGQMRDSVVAVKNVYDSAKASGDTNYGASIKAMRSPESYLLGKSVGLTTGQGIGAYLLLSMAFGGTTGLWAAISEAKDQPVKFLAESFLYSTLVGPLGQVVRYVADPNDAPSATFAKSLFPGVMLDEVHAMLTGQGLYKNTTGFERVGTFFTRRVPISGPMGTGLAILGLSDRDAGLEASIKGYWKWRKDEVGPIQAGTPAAEETDKLFRVHMRRAMEAIRHNQDPRKDVEKALKVSGKDDKMAARSILARRLLKPLEKYPDKIASLRKRVGEEAFAKLVAYDELLTKWAGTIRNG